MPPSTLNPTPASDAILVASAFNASPVALGPLENARIA
jgi:hypothetical protein